MRSGLRQLFFSPDKRRSREGSIASLPDFILMETIVTSVPFAKLSLLQGGRGPPIERLIGSSSAMSVNSVVSSQLYVSERFFFHDASAPPFQIPPPSLNLLSLSPFPTPILTPILPLPLLKNTEKTRSCLQHHVQLLQSYQFMNYKRLITATSQQ